VAFVRRGVQLRSSPSDWGPSFCPRLERAARPGETTQSGGGVMVLQAPSTTVHDTTDARRVAKQAPRRHSRDHALGLGRATLGTHGAILSTARRLPSVMGHVGRQTAHPQPQRVGGSSVSPGRRASHRIRTTDQMKTEKRGVPGGAGLSAPRSLLAYFGMPPAASPIKARQS
jgi:hypothetical protein